MPRRAARLNMPTTKAPIAEVEVRHIVIDSWTLPQALDLLQSGYSLPYVANKTGRDRVELAQAARARRIPIREK